MLHNDKMVDKPTTRLEGIKSELEEPIRDINKVFAADKIGRNSELIDDREHKEED